MNPKLGYYKVNDQIFYNKLQAIMFANPTLADITWHFNNEVFDNTLWEEEPPGTIDFYYAERAKQIREQFDYVIIMCSGGADSTNTLYSFLKNGIKVDEVIAGAPVSGLSNWKPNLNDTSARNIISETFFAQLPLMEKVSKQFPDVKITIHDYFEDMLKLKTDEWIYEASGHWVHFSGTVRHSLEKFRHIRDLAEAGKKVAVVYGIDKPIIHRAVSGNLYSVIMDPVVNVVTPHFKDKYPNVESVLFYYSPEMPLLLVKQAHEVCKAIYKPENKVAKSYLWDKSTPEEYQVSSQRGSKWQRSIIPIIYPSIAPEQTSVWQADKQGVGFQGGFEMDSWMYELHKDLRIVQLIESDLKLFLSKVNTKYLSALDKGYGFVRCANHWKIGHESKFMPKI